MRFELWNLGIKILINLQLRWKTIEDICICIASRPSDYAKIIFRKKLFAMKVEPKSFNTKTYGQSPLLRFGILLFSTAEYARGIVNLPISVIFHSMTKHSSVPYGVVSALSMRSFWEVFIMSQNLFTWKSLLSPQKSNFIVFGPQPLSFTTLDAIWKKIS